MSVEKGQTMSGGGVSVAIGIDPGLDGGLAVLANDTRPVLSVTPVLNTRRPGKTAGGNKRSKRVYDLHAMRELLDMWTFADAGDVLVVIESQRPMPRQGVTSMFSVGYGYGLWLGLLVGLAIPHRPVDPRIWQRALCLGIGGDPKESARRLVEARFPDLDLRATPRCRTPHKGLIDALAIALYAKSIT